MKYEGRISRLLEVREGTSMRTGQPWKALPFIFEFFEQEEDRYASFVKLETFDTKVMQQIAQFIAKDEESGKAIIKDGSMELLQNVNVRCDFRLNINIFNGKIYNEVLLRDIEVLTKAEEKPNEEPTVSEIKDNSFAGLEPADELPF